MIQRIPAKERYLAAHGWLNSYHLFSFAEYYDPRNQNVGNLRVFNDDFIIGESGFSDHAHHDMEIVTIMYEGELTHRDSMGNEKTIRAGEVQVMTAGTGVMHAEINKGKTPVRLYQIWIHPREQGLAPAYAQKDFSFLLKKNALTALASGEGGNEALNINADASIFVGQLERGASLPYDIQPNRGVFIYVSEGKINIGDQEFVKGDQARIWEEKSILLAGVENTRFILILAKM